MISFLNTFGSPWTMPVYQFDTKIVAFIHIPKCAGSTIENALESYLLGFLRRDHGKHDYEGNILPVSPQHFSVKQLKSFINFESCFSITRHPLSRLESEYRFQRKHKLTHIACINDFSGWLTAALDKYFLNNNIFDGHLRPNSFFIDGSVTIFPLENSLLPLKDFLESIANVKLESLMQNANATANINEPAMAIDIGEWSKKYDIKGLDVERLLEIYQEDKKLGYSF